MILKRFISIQKNSNFLFSKINSPFNILLIAFNSGRKGIIAISVIIAIIRTTKNLRESLYSKKTGIKRAKVAALEPEIVIKKISKSNKGVL